jgi:hypothetical protein
MVRAKGTTNEIPLTKRLVRLVVHGWIMKAWAVITLEVSGVDQRERGYF